MSSLTSIFGTTYQEREISAGRITVIIQVLLPTLIFVGLCLFFSSHYSPGVDDAYITYRYAWNFYNGYGLVYNSNLQPVEGYSTLLYALIIAAGFLFVGHDDVYKWSLSINIVFGFLSILVIYLYTKNRLGQWWAFILVIFVASCPTMAYWSWSGMETMMIVFFQILIWLTVSKIEECGRSNKDIALLSLVSMGSCLGRIDGFILPSIACLYLWLRSRRREAYIVGAIVITFTFSYLAWSYGYYGEAFRNTARAKVDGDLWERIGWAYLISSKVVFTRGFIMPLLVLMIISWISFLNWSRINFAGTMKARILCVIDSYHKIEQDDRLKNIVRIHLDKIIKLLITRIFWSHLRHIIFIFLSCIFSLKDHRFFVKREKSSFPFWIWIFVSILAYWIYVGGDIFFERWLVIIYLISFYVIIDFLINQCRILSPAIKFFVLLLVFASSIYPVFCSWYYEGMKDRSVELGRSLRVKYPNQQISLATIAAGMVPYVTDFRTVYDASGLNDLWLASQETKFQFLGHNKFNYRYILERKPDLIILIVLPRVFASLGDDGKVNIERIDLFVHGGGTLEEYELAGYKLAYWANFKNWILNEASSQSVSVQKLVKDGVVPTAGFLVVLEKETVRVAATS